MSQIFFVAKIDKKVVTKIGPNFLAYSEPVRGGWSASRMDFGV